MPEPGTDVMGPVEMDEVVVVGATVVVGREVTGTEVDELVEITVLVEVAAADLTQEQTVAAALIPPRMALTRVDPAQD